MPKPTRKKPLSLSNCSLAKAADIIGDRWTLLILCEFFHGAYRFGEFVDILGLARSLLTDRLGRLEQHGLIERCALLDSPGREGYLLTSKGEATFPVIAALMQWGDDCLSDDGIPVQMVDRKTGRNIRVAVLPDNRTDHSRRAQDVLLKAGPGARKGTRERMAFIEARRTQHHCWCEPPGLATRDLVQSDLRKGL